MRQLRVAQGTVLLLLTILAGLAGSYQQAVAGQGKPSLARATALPVPDAPAEAKPYQIRRGDELAIRVLGEEKLSHSYIVGPDGRITLDFIGNVEAAGLTREQLAERLSSRLADIYYHPVVSVAVTKYTPVRAYVLGQVLRPGVVEFATEASFLKALTVAGGVARESSPGQVYGEHIYAPPELAYIVRNPDTIINIDLKDLLEHGNRALDVPLQDDDLIFVPVGKHKQVFVMGEVARPTVLDLKQDDLTVLGAINKAGGWTNNAALADVKLIRRAQASDRNPQVISLNLKNLTKKGDLSQDLKLQDQDVIVVPRSKSSYLRFITQSGSVGLLSLVLSLTSR